MPWNWPGTWPCGKRSGRSASPRWTDPSSPNSLLERIPGKWKAEPSIRVRAALTGPIGPHDFPCVFSALVQSRAFRILGPGSVHRRDRDFIDDGRGVKMIILPAINQQGFVFGDIEGGRQSE